MGGVTVGCVVLNWNGWQDTLVCLQTLAAQSHAQLQVLVIDNGSTDDSVARIEAFLRGVRGPVSFTLIENGVNAGFAKGSNAGIREALRRGCDFVWLLNNDVECPPDTLEKLVRTAEQQPGAGMVGTVLYYHHNPREVQAWSGGHINRWLGTSRHFHGPDTLRRGSYVTFASALVRSQVFREIGLLYEGAFMYYEDADFGLRLEKTHWKIAVAADTAVLHKEGGSTEGKRQPFMEKTIAVAGLKFLRRHSPFPAFSMSAFLAIKLLNRLRLREWASLRAVLQAPAVYWREGA